MVTVHLTEEQKTTKIQIERVIEEELKPIVEQTKQKVAHLELMVQTLQDKVRCTSHSLLSNNPNREMIYAKSMQPWRRILVIVMGNIPFRTSML